MIALGSSIIAAANLFANSTSHAGGVFKLDNGNISFIQNKFIHDYATRAAVIYVRICNVTSHDDVVVFNVGEESVIEGYYSEIDIYSIFIGYNRAINRTIFNMHQGTFVSNGTVLESNVGEDVLFMSDSRIIVDGLFHVSNCNASYFSILRVIFSRVIINGISIMANNQAACKMVQAQS